MTDITILARERAPFGLSLPLISSLLAYAAVLGSGLGGAMLGDPDTYWHVATGHWIIAHRSVPNQDVFSFSMPGAPWTPPEWLAEVVFAWLYDHFGWAGPVVATALCFVAALSLLLRATLRYMEPVYAMIATVLASGLTVSHLWARPHILILPILVIWVAALVKARTEDHSPPLWLASLMCLWSNLHGSYMFGLGIAGLFAAEAVLTAPSSTERYRGLRDWAIFSTASLAAVLISPFGIEGLLLPFKLNNMAANAFVGEWQSPNFQKNLILEVWIALLLFASITRGWRVPWTRAAMLLLILHMTLQHARFGELLGFVTPLLLGPVLGPQLAMTSRHSQSTALDSIMAKFAKPASVSGIVTAAIAFVAISSIGLHRNINRQSDSITPASALAAVETNHIHGAVFNDYSFGGYMIFQGIKPFIDVRYFYGDSFIERYVQALTGVSDELPRLLGQYGIRWTILRPASPANSLLAHLPGWRLLYADDIAIVYVSNETGDPLK